jgi:SAM-dependent methyltransferase
MVFATQFIEHVDADRFLREVARVLRPGGTLVIGTVYRTDPRAGAIDPTHIHEYHSLGELAGEMRRHGFTSRLAVLTPVMFSPLDRVFRVLYMFTHSRRLVELPKKRIVSRLRWATRIRVKAAYFLEVIGDSFA